jgi:hypothetical protein
VGDLNPALRALTPGAVRSAIDGAPDPLLRLFFVAVGVAPSTPKPPSPPEESVDSGVFLDTTCEEAPFPWQRANSASARRREALAVLHAFPKSAFYPFDSSIAWNASVIPVCLHWPDASASPPPASALPDVPALILSGAQDLRTPTSNARQLGAELPRSQLLVVPRAGHSVIGSDFSGCAHAAVLAFFSAEPVQPCAVSRNPFPPAPSPPRKLADVPAFPGIRGRAGRTITAVLDTLLDFDHELDAATLQRGGGLLPVGSRFGGLHGGFLTLTSAGYRLVRFAAIPGVKLSGSFKFKHGKELTSTLVIAGKTAAHGVLRINSKRVSGRLEGIRFDVARAKAKLTAAQAREESWPSAPIGLPAPRLTPLRY